MIDYDKIDDDPIVAEVRRAREEIAAEFNYDLRAICEDVQRQQAASGAKYTQPPSGGRESIVDSKKKAG
jgi:hypothetical protein